MENGRQNYCTTLMNPNLWEATCSLLCINILSAGSEKTLTRLKEFNLKLTC